MSQPSIRVNVAPWLSQWLSAYVQRCHDKGIKPDFSLMRCIAGCATGVLR